MKVEQKTCSVDESFSRGSHEADVLMVWCKTAQGWILSRGVLWTWPRVPLNSTLWCILIFLTKLKRWLDTSWLIWVHNVRWAEWTKYFTLEEKVEDRSRYPTTWSLPLFKQEHSHASRMSHVGSRTVMWWWCGPCIFNQERRIRWGMTSENDIEMVEVGVVFPSTRVRNENIYHSLPYLIWIEDTWQRRGLSPLMTGTLRWKK